jgi:hypothetical protein
MTLPVTGLYVVRVSASPAQIVFPPTNTPYTIYHQSLRPDEFSIPIIARGTFLGGTGPLALDRVTGLSMHIAFDPAVVRMTGVDLGQGTRNLFIGQRDDNPATAQEFVAEQVPGTPGLVRFATRSYRDNLLQQPNGLKGDGRQASGCFPCPELVIARLRFRAVGPGDTTVRIVDNPTSVGAQLLNLGLGEFLNGPVWQPEFGYGPGVQISVTEAPAATSVPLIPAGATP